MNQESALSAAAVNLHQGLGLPGVSLGGLVTGPGSQLVDDPGNGHLVFSMNAFDSPSSPIDMSSLSISEPFHSLIGNNEPLMTDSLSTNGVECVPSTSNDNYASYDDIFPALPEADVRPVVQWGPQSRNFTPVVIMKPLISNVTQVFRLAPENRKSDIVGSRPDQGKVCNDVMQKTGTSIEVSSSKDGTLTFLITGKEDAVQQAKRVIASELQTQSTANVPIPKDHHRHILGKSGTKLKNLETNTGTKITVPRQTDESNLIKIVGPKEGIEKAMHEIQLISNEHASRAMERLTIEKEYHAFISGPHGETAKQITLETGAKINIPPPSVNKNEISVNGDTVAVAKARDIILRIYEEKKRNCQTVYVEVKKQQHRYVIGPKGQTLQEIFKKTGVSIEMPPTENPSETITLRGEQEKLGPALTLLYEKAHSEIDEELDAPSWIQKYIIGPKGSHFQEISADFQTTVNVSFAANENKIKMHGPRKDVERAKEVLQAEIQRVMRDVSVCEVKVDAKYHRFVIGKSGQTVNQIRAKTGAQINIPSEVEGQATNLIRIEGKPDEVESAKAEVEAIIKKRMETDAMVTKEMLIEQRFHKQIIGAKGENIREIRDRFNQVVITFPESSVKSDKVAVRGPKEDVDKCCKYLATLNKDLLANNYRAEVPIFKPFHKFIIGKDGANIKKIRDETGTKIDLPAENAESDVIVITGKKDAVDKATERIQQFQNELTNVQQVDIIIPAKFHNSIIGAKGRQIRSIMEECGGVTIKFPDEGSGSDKVSIRGPKECAMKAKQMLVDLSNEKQVSGFSVEVKAKSQLHRFLIGKNGANIRKLRESSGARIFFPSEKEDTKDSDTVVIQGKKEDVLKAQVELETMIKDLERIVEDEVVVDPKYHKHFVTRQGRVLRQISDDLGGVIISFPKSSQKNSDKVTLKGSKECVEQAKQRILEEVDTLNSTVTVECPIEQQHHRAVMGSRGTNVQGIQNQHKVHIKFPERAKQNGNAEHVNGDSKASDDDASVKSEHVAASPKRSDVILITGRQEDCDAAKEALLASIPVEIDVEVPFDYHRFIIGKKGAGVRELMETYDVQITVPPSNEQSDTVKITGIKENAENARQGILEKVEKLDQEKQDREARSYKVELRVAPDFHPKIIGRKGAVITKIRTKHDVQIQFPERSGDSAGDASLITVVGYEKNALAARDEIMSLVGDLEALTTKDISVDAKVHRRIIGGRGKGIALIMQKYNVSIKFPQSGDADPNLVSISGQDEDVEDAIDHILNLEAEFLEDAEEQYRAPRSMANSNSNDSPAGGKKEFVVKGAPWSAPDTNNTEEFPSFGINASGGDEPSSSPWGPRYGSK
ncbi:Vigilin [Halotydeus destructor]|nr:Vigilin [Halotydeus destructor]